MATNETEPIEATSTLLVQAIDAASRKHAEGKLIKVSDDSFDWGNPENWSTGDPETIYSITSLYAQFGEPDAHRVIEARLMELYPDFV